MTADDSVGATDGEDGGSDATESGDSGSDATGSEGGGNDATESGDSGSDATGSEGGGSDATDSDDAGGDTFGVGIQVTDSEFRFVVHVPAEIDSGWTDPDAFQRQIERYTWTELDKRETLGAITETATAGETVTLGTVTMRPDGTVTASSLSVPGV